MKFPNARKLVSSKNELSDFNVRKFWPYLLLAALLLSILLIGVRSYSLGKVVERDSSRRQFLSGAAGFLNKYFTDNGYFVGTLSDLRLEKTGYQSLKFVYKAYGLDGTSPCSTEDRNCMSAMLYSTYESPKTPCAKGRGYLGWTSSSGITGKICSVGVPSPDDTPVTD